MARVHKVAKSAKVHLCGHFPTHYIDKGDPYYWAAPGFRSRTKMIRCVDHPFRESDLITGNRADIVRAREDAIDAIDGAESIADIESAMSEFESAADDYLNLRQEALDAWPNGNSQLQEYVDQAESITSEVGGWSNSFGYADDDEPDNDDLDPFTQDALSDGDPFSRDDMVELWLQARLDDVKEEARDLLEGLDV